MASVRLQIPNDGYMEKTNFTTGACALVLRLSCSVFGESSCEAFRAAKALPEGFGMTGTVYVFVQQFWTGRGRADARAGNGELGAIQIAHLCTASMAVPQRAQP